LNVAELVPTLVEPFNTHWYVVIVPNAVEAVAVNVAELPAKIVVQLAAIDTVGASTEFTT
jgi:hypothetical protein